MSYFLNESTQPPAELAEILIRSWEKHLDDEGIVILCEPALKLQSRKLLELRKELIHCREKLGAHWLKILIPCLGHQGCGALAQEDDWCHEEVSWWRPPYFRTIDKMAGLDRKTLPFSYLVIARSKRKLDEILPALSQAPAQMRERLVSPAHFEGRDQEFFLCGQNGKRRARYRNPAEEAEPLQRGDILAGAKIRGDVNSSRVEEVDQIL
jgi:hypothetical protein